MVHKMAAATDLPNLGPPRGLSRVVPRWPCALLPGALLLMSYLKSKSILVNGGNGS